VLAVDTGRDQFHAAKRSTYTRQHTRHNMKLACVQP
jgi:hypothetical protein